MTQKIKIVMITKNFILDGISSVIENYCDHLPADKYDITILSGNEVDEKYLGKYQTGNIKIVKCPSKATNPLQYYLSIYRYLKNNPSEIAHIHGNSATMAVELLIARICGIKIRIAHSHSDSSNHPLLHKLMMPACNSLSVRRLACSKQAGDFTFKNVEYSILPNAFCTSKYSYNKEKRVQLRKDLGIEDKMVLGHIGRFNTQKNQSFLIKIFESFAMQRDDVVLLLVGTGKKFDLVKESIPDNLKDQVIFYGETVDISGLLSAMDVFIFPSKYEGLGIAAVEAQISGLPCLLSNVIPKEVDLGGDVQWLSIEDSPAVWAKKIHTVPEKERENFIENHADTISMYEIENSVGILDNIYSELVEKIM